MYGFSSQRKQNGKFPCEEKFSVYSLLRDHKSLLSKISQKLLIDFIEKMESHIYSGVRIESMI